MKSDGRKAGAASAARACRAVFWLMVAASGCAPSPASTPPATPEPAAAPPATSGVAVPTDGVATAAVGVAATPPAGSAPPPAPKPCDRARRCGGEAPLCLVAKAGSRCGTLSEADALPHDGAHAALACGGRADCAAGERCCTNPLWDRTRCAARCDPANEAELCDADSDCSGKARCRAADGGASPDALPTWVKACTSQ